MRQVISSCTDLFPSVAADADSGVGVDAGAAAGAVVGDGAVEAGAGVAGAITGAGGAAVCPSAAETGTDGDSAARTMRASGDRLFMTHCAEGMACLATCGRKKTAGRSPPFSGIAGF